jgi:hypothetical protein
MQGSTTQPKVFISYSWSSPQHEQWVLDLADMLSRDGILVMLDKWDLKEGHDKHVFMEQMVNDPEVKKVLVICDAIYQAKADKRAGGVGTETQLISKEVYENTGQEKFIPIIKEYDTNGKPCMPAFFASRIHIDLSSDDSFEPNYQKLVRNLYDKPLLKRPPIGGTPSYITEDDPVYLKTSNRVRAIKDAIINERKTVNGLISDYLDTFLSSLEDFRISGGAKVGFDDDVVQSIEKMLPLRDDFIDFTFTVFRYQESVNLEQIHAFFEELKTYSRRKAEEGSYTEIDFDNYKFFMYELMLNFMSILFKLRKYSDAAFFINSQYFYRDRYSDLAYEDLGAFNSNIRSLNEFRNNRLELRRVNVTADLIKTRSTRSDITFDDIKETDQILYYIYQFKGREYGWFPHTSVYESRNMKIDIFLKMVSRQFFEKVKGMFEVSTVEEFKKRANEQIAKYAGSQSRMDTWNYHVRGIDRVFDLEHIGTVN